MKPRLLNSKLKKRLRQKQHVRRKKNALDKRNSD